LSVWAERGKQSDLSDDGRSEGNRDSGAGASRASAIHMNIFGRNQGVQHPLAQAWARVEAANLMVMHAAALYDSGEACGVEANAA